MNVISKSKRKPKCFEEKKQLKHAVAGVEIIDRLTAKTKDPEEIILLNQLKKEFKRLWQQLKQ